MRSLVKTRNRFYTFILGVIGIGYGWLFLNYWGFQPADTAGYAFCLFKEVTGLACPACGTTRSLLAIMQGALEQGFYWNPLGFLIMGLMIIMPLWILMDLVTGSKSFQQAYQSLEQWLSQKKVFIPFFGLILLNWLWNLMKGL